ncbi:unnamed protein product [Discosporangium mesarthrocarpum]
MFSYILLPSPAISTPAFICPLSSDVISIMGKTNSALLGRAQVLKTRSLWPWRPGIRGRAIERLGMVLREAERARADEGPDELFYEKTRLSFHADHGSLAQLTAVYKEVVPGGSKVLDLCSSWVSHLPEGVNYAHVEGHGLNSVELRCNPDLDHFFTQDLNGDSRKLPLECQGLDAALCCCGWQYLKHPEEVAKEVAQVLRPAAPFVVSFAGSCFPTKTVRGWIMRDSEGRRKLVSECLEVGVWACGCVGVWVWVCVPPAFVLHLFEALARGFVRVEPSGRYV